MDIQTPSKQKIVNGVIALLSEKRLSAVKVSDITARSGVSHQTFYRVFTDKYDACEYSCYRLLANAELIVGDNATVKDHTLCTLNIVKTNGGFFRHLLAEDDGVEIVKKALTHLSKDTISFSSEPPILGSWVFCLQEWSKNNYTAPTEEVYYRILSCYPIGEVLFGKDLIKALTHYGSYKMKELDSFVNVRPNREHK